MKFATVWHRVRTAVQLDVPPKKFNADMEAKIIDAWADGDTRTYREVAKDLGLPMSTVHRWVVQRGLRRRGTKKAMGDMAPSASMWTHRTRRCVHG